MLLCHCVEENASGVNVNKNKFESLCEWLHNNFEEDIWLASFEDVSIYNEQLKNAKINYLKADYQSMTFNISCGLDKNIYDYPMSITVPLPSFADSAYAIIDGVEYDLTVENSSPYEKEALILDVPVNGTEVKVIFGGNKNYKNGCIHHIYKKSNVVQATCTERGFTEMECMYCLHTYIVKYVAPRHTYGSVTLKKQETREDGVYLINYRVCEDCGYEEIISEQLME